MLRCKKLQEELNSIAKQIESGERKNEGNRLPENTKDTKAGTEVALEDGWGTENVSYVRTKDGSEIKNVTKVSTVYAVSVGEGNTVPVPKEFYYVGGTFSSGVVISDNKADKNKYAGVEDVPAGVIYNSDGTVKQEANLTEEEKKTVILGNQFVWIPCEASEYKKTDWGKASETWEKQTHSSELPQIEKYGGFYIGRYEAGTSNITLSTGINFVGKNTASSWQNNNFSIRDGLNHTVTGTITIKAGEIPYYHADYFTALELTNKMYSTNYVKSVLPTGTMWDIMLKFITDGDNTMLTSSKWGNFNNTSTNITYTAGQGRYGTIDSNSGATTSEFKVMDGKYHYGIKTTASSEDVKKKNLYDVAGNLWEWTEEVAYTTKSYMLRGGSFNNSYSEYPVCYRNGGHTTSNTYTNFGFRPALYIK